MGCAEVKDAIDWAKRTTPSTTYPVTAFLTIHIGEKGRPGSPVGTDICIYAYGPVRYVAEPTAHLAGDLQYFGNGVTLKPEMLPKLGMTIGVEIFQDDRFTYQFKFNGAPVAGFPTKLTGTCLQDVLLTATMLSDVVTIGVRRDPAITTPGATKPAKKAAKKKPAKKAAKAKPR
ncbi:MAG: hypothetical protein ACRD12_17690 [Acidimicrobiales bacterium]